MLAAYVRSSNELSKMTSMSELNNQLQGLFANSSEQIVDKAMEMTFTAKTTLDDIVSFGVHIRNPYVANMANGNE